MSAEHQLPSLPARAPDSHKGNFGRILVVGGSVGMSGAVALAGSAALRSGAGLVTVACPETVAPIVAAFDPCLMTVPLPCTTRGMVSIDSLPKIFSQRADVLALGPGMGRCASVSAVVCKLLLKWNGPIVLDADGLFALADTGFDICQRKGATIITPHVLEFSRLTGQTTQAIQREREASASAYAKRTGAVVVLKGKGTVITDGATTYVNQTGNPGLATAGAGDVLTGVLAALLGQGLNSLSAAQLGCHLHGLAGDLFLENRDQACLTARDLLDCLPIAFRRHNQRTGNPA